MTSGQRPSSSIFPPTDWSLVGRTQPATATDPSIAARALDSLCRAYWRPLYTLARGSGLPSADAQDAVQDFFARALHAHLFERADPNRGSLRSLLASSFKNSLIDRNKRKQAAKRTPSGGWSRFDFDEAEIDWAKQYSDGCASSPDVAYEREWARSLLTAAYEQTSARYAAEGRSDLFTCLAPEALDTRAIAGKEYPTMSPGARRVAMHRLRKRYGEALREIVAATLPPGGDVDAELRALAISFGAVRP